MTMSATEPLPEELNFPLKELYELKFEGVAERVAVQQADLSHTTSELDKLRKRTHALANDLQDKYHKTNEQYIRQDKLITENANSIRAVSLQQEASNKAIEKLTTALLEVTQSFNEVRVSVQAGFNTLGVVAKGVLWITGVSGAVYAVYKWIGAYT